MRSDHSLLNLQESTKKVELVSERSRKGPSGTLIYEVRIAVPKAVFSRCRLPLASKICFTDSVCCRKVPCFPQIPCPLHVLFLAWSISRPSLLQSHNKPHPRVVSLCNLYFNLPHPCMTPCRSSMTWTAPAGANTSSQRAPLPGTSCTSSTAQQSASLRTAARQWRAILPACRRLQAHLMF